MVVWFFEHLIGISCILKQNIYHTVGTGPKMEDKGKNDTLCTQILSRLGTGNSIECAEMRGG
jgi:hypothetical protein